MRNNRRTPKAMPPRLWKKHMFFIMCSDRTLSRYTEEQFPRTVGSSHSVFVLDLRPDQAHTICPCSSSNHNPQSNRRYIEAGTTFKESGKAIFKDTHLIEDCAFTIPKGSDFEDDFGRYSEYGGMYCWGVVPEDRIRERQGA